jgi:hypothetical protein
MRDRKPIELSDKAKTRALASIQRYFLENMDWQQKKRSG